MNEIGLIRPGCATPFLTASLQLLYVLVSALLRENHFTGNIRPIYHSKGDRLVLQRGAKIEGGDKAKDHRDQVNHV